MKQKATIEYGIIGLGTFGSALAKKLSHAGKEVLALDQSEDKVNEIKDYVDTSFVIKSLDRSVLEETGIQNCETVIVGISKDIAMSVLTTLNIINMGVPRVIAKAHSDDHGMILEKLGASVVYPERDMAERIGGMLLNSRKLELFFNGVKLTYQLKDGLYRIYTENEKFVGIGMVKNNLLKREIIVEN